VLKLLSPTDASAVPVTRAGFVPLNPTLADTVLAEIGWP
jgi:hypothetical protein